MALSFFFIILSVCNLMSMTDSVRVDGEVCPELIDFRDGPFSFHLK